MSDELIARLDSAEPATRRAAAMHVCEMRDPTRELIPTLLARLDDPGKVEEEWSDWTGYPCGGTTHHVADNMFDALARFGTPAFEAAVAAGTSSAVQRLAARLPMDELLAAGPGVIAHASSVARDERADRNVPPSSQASVSDQAAYALAWACDELSRTEARVEVLVRRLSYALNDTATRASRELGTVGPVDAPRAASALAEVLLREPWQQHASTPTVASALDTLGPVLDAAHVAKLVAAAPTHAMFFCWPELILALASYGEAARDLQPWLLAWIRDGQPSVQISDKHRDATRKAAAVAIRRLGAGARPLLDALAETYSVADDAHRKLVLSAFSDRSVLVSALAPRWRVILAGTDQAAIAATLARIRDLGRAAVPLLDAIAPFLDRDYNAVLLVGELDEAARPFVPALIRALDDPRLCEWACYALRDLGPDVARTALAPLEQVVARDRASKRFNSAAPSALEALRRS